MTMEKISTTLGIEWPHELAEAEPEVAAFLSAAHRHHHVPDHVLDEDTDVSDWVLEVYHALCHASERGETEQWRGRLSAVRRQMNSAMRLFGPETVRLKAEIETLRSDLRGVKSLLEEGQSNVGRLEFALAETRLELAESETISTEREAIVQTLLSSLSWRLTHPLRVLWNFASRHRILGRREAGATGGKCRAADRRR